MSVAAALQIAAAVGIAYVAGFGAVWHALGRFDPPWLAALAGGLVISFVGYYYAYRGIYRVEDGPRLRTRVMVVVVTAGFGGFLAHGGGALDKYALLAAGADERDASVRVTALAGMEHGILGYVGSGAAIAVLAMGLSAPPDDFTIPWSVIPVPATAAAFVLAERYRHRLRERSGWHSRLSVFLDAIHLIRKQILQPRRYGLTIGGMVLFWVTDAFSVWAALAAFGFFMNGAALMVGFGMGMVFTRRTGPLAGAGILMLVLPLTIWYSGAPLATAVVAIFAYRVLSLWGPMPFCSPASRHCARWVRGALRSPRAPVRRKMSRRCDTAATADVNRRESPLRDVPPAAANSAARECRTVKWRAGCEGRISVTPKRQYGRTAPAWTAPKEPGPGPDTGSWPTT